MSQTNEKNSAETTSRNSSSVESGEKKEEQNTPEDNIANIREKPP